MATAVHETHLVVVHEQPFAHHSIRLDEELEQGLEAACAATGRSRSESVRDALRRHAL